MGSEEEVVEKTVGMRKGGGSSGKGRWASQGQRNLISLIKKVTFISESSKSSHASLLKEKDS